MSLIVCSEELAQSYNALGEQKIQQTDQNCERGDKDKNDNGVLLDLALRRPYDLFELTLDAAVEILKFLFELGVHKVQNKQHEGSENNDTEGYDGIPRKTLLLGVFAVIGSGGLVGRRCGRLVGRGSSGLRRTLGTVGRGTVSRKKMLIESMESISASASIAARLLKNLTDVIFRSPLL